MSLAMASAPSWRSSWRSGTARDSAAWWWPIRWLSSPSRRARRSAAWRNASRRRACRPSSIPRSGACFRPSSPRSIPRSSPPARRRLPPSTRNALRAPASRLLRLTSARAPKKSTTRRWCSAARWIRPRHRRWPALWPAAFRARTTRRSRGRATARCWSNPMPCWREWASFWPAACTEPASGAAEPVVALVLPVAARVLVGDEDRGDVLGVLEAELGRDAQLHRKAVLGRQHLVGVLEGDVACAEVRADALQEIGKAHAAPLADRAPALDADVARDLRGLGQRVELGQAPGPGFLDAARELEL